jgi:hypothetical protein
MWVPRNMLEYLFVPRYRASRYLSVILMRYRPSARGAGARHQISQEIGALRAPFIQGSED